MLFCLDESILNVLDEELVIDAIINLTMSVKKGKHLIYAKRHVLKALIESPYLEKSQKDIFNKTLSKISKTKSYLNNFNRRIELVGDIDSINKYIDNLEKQVIKIPIKLLENPTLVSECRLLLEDINDYKLYKFITEYVLFKKNLTNIKFNLETMHGAGGGITNVFKEKVSTNNYLVASIVDTDKTSPDEGLHATALPLVKEYKKNKNTCLGEVFFSNCHEAENLIPHFCYEELNGLSRENITTYLETAASSQHSSKINFPINWNIYQCMIHHLKRYDVFNYFDYKNGLILSHFRNINSAKYWSKLLLDMGVDFDINEYTPIHKDNKHLLIIEGFNNNVLNNSFDILTRFTFTQIDELLTDSLKNIWYDIGNFLLDWGCCTSPIRVV